MRHGWHTGCCSCEAVGPTSYSSSFLLRNQEDEAAIYGTSQICEELVAEQAGGRPPLRQDAKLKPHSIGFWPDLWEAVGMIASRRGQSVSEYIRDVLLQDAELQRLLDEQGGDAA